MKLGQLHEARRAGEWLTKPYSGQEGYVYRGMSLEEWETSLKRGSIQSDARYCYPEQGGGTCYGSFDDAEHYGIETEVWGPENIHVSPKDEYERDEPYRGIIIEIPRELTADRSQDERVDFNQYMHWDSLPISVVRRVWLLTPIVQGEEVRYKRERVK